MVTKLTIGAVFFLILVGGIVRSTGAGMGCPDWPKCFGQWVPPTQASELPDNYRDIYSAKRAAKNQRLSKYLDAFGFSELANQLKNDPAILEEAEFNATKTWIEYVNRLIGSLIGLFILGTFAASLKFRKIKPSVFWLSFASVILVLLQGWIGSIVVSTNLLPGMITLHMVLAIVLEMLLILALIQAYQVEIHQYRQQNDAASTILLLGLLATSLTFIQVVLGTQVRENVDVIITQIGYENRTQWIENLGTVYQVHKFFYYLLVVALAAWVWKMKDLFASVPILKRLSIGMGILIGSEVIFGICMHYLAIPPILQPLHLLFATILFSLEFAVLVLCYQLFYGKFKWVESVTT